LEARGVKDILIACTDNLTGDFQMLSRVYLRQRPYKLVLFTKPASSLSYVASKNPKEFFKDLKQVYQAINKEQAETAMDDLELK
jgi:transposase-like protein